MSFKQDLEHLIRRQFDKLGIQYDKNMRVDDLAARYLEMLNRRIDPTPRRVHLSQQIYDSLGALTREEDVEQSKKALDAWRALFRIRHFLVRGGNVNAFLSKQIDSATGKRSKDGFLWDFGMHHFHLSNEVQASGFAKRSDYLLFARVTAKDAYLVDVRRHPHPQDLGWVRQDLLQIVHSNWPELVAPNILPGVTGDELTDQERGELRRKNINVVTNLGGEAVAPLGGGMTMDGSSVMCRYFADALMHEIERHREFFDTPPANLRSALQDKGIATTPNLEFDLVLGDRLELTADQTKELSDERCLSQRLFQMGFVVVERTSRFPIVVMCDDA